MTATQRFVNAVGRLSDACGVIAATMIVVAVVITCQMIWVRYVLNASTVWQTEAVIYLMVGATLLGLPYVQRMRGHVNVDLLPIWLGVGARRWLAIGVLCVASLIIGLMLWYGAALWWEAFDRGWKSETIWGVRLWIPYLAMPVGFGLFLLQLVADLLGQIARIERPFGLAESPRT